MRLNEKDRRLLQEAAALTDFFGGRSLSKVDRLLLLIARMTSPPPEWLRGTSKLTHLPRYRTIRSGARVPLDGISKPDVARRVMWIVENQHGAWCLNKETLLFADDTDAVHFGLRWSSSD